MCSKKHQMAKMLQIIHRDVEIKGSSKDTKKSAAQDRPPTLDLSIIEKATSFEDCQNSLGNPLHSTALEDDFSPNVGQDKKEAAGKKEVAKGIGQPSKKGNVETPKITTQTGRGQTPGRGGKVVQPRGSTRKGKDQKTRVETKSKARHLEEIVKGSDDEDMTGQSGSSASGARAPVAEQHSTEADDSEAEVPSDTEKEEKASSPGVGPGSGPTQRRRRPPLSSEELTEEEGSRNPSKKKKTRQARGNVEPPKRTTQTGRGQTPGRGGKVVQPRGSTRKGKDQKTLETKSKARPLEEIVEGSDDEDMTGQSGSSASGARAPVAEQHSTEADDSNPSKKKKTRQEKPRKSVGDRQSSKGSRRKSSSGSSSGRAGSSKRDEPRKRNVKNPMDLDVVLDSFLEFASQYKETVDSEAVKQAIDALSSSFEEQLTEKITASKELTFLKKENAKMNVIVNRKRTRLLEAKNELITSETELSALQKEHAKLKQRLTDLRRGTTFLRDLGQLHKSYLGHRKAHPNQVETYGPSSLPALLLEARSVLTAEDQLKAVNARLQRALDQAAPPH